MGNLEETITVAAENSDIDSGLASQVSDKPLGSTKFVKGSNGGPI